MGSRLQVLGILRPPPLRAGLTAGGLWIALAVFLRSSAEPPRPIHLWPALPANKERRRQAWLYELGSAARRLGFAISAKRSFAEILFIN